MIEMGKNKTVTVRQRIDGELRPVLENGQPVTKTVSAAVWRVTRHGLDGSFGRDRNRKLVIGLTAVDTVVIYPQGTRQRVSITVDDIYRCQLRCLANAKTLERARFKKEAKQKRLSRQREARAEKRLTADAKQNG